MIRRQAIKQITGNRAHNRQSGTSDNQARTDHIDDEKPLTRRAAELLRRPLAVFKQLDASGVQFFSGFLSAYDKVDTFINIFECASPCALLLLSYSDATRCRAVDTVSN